MKTESPSTAASRVPTAATQLCQSHSELAGQLPRQHIFLFVNPLSGGNAANCFLQDGIAHASTQTRDGQFFKLHISDIRDGPPGEKPMFLELKRIVEYIKENKLGERVTVILAGGDGTVMWGISEVWEHHIDDSFIVFGTIPFGTGNDFAKALSWQPVTIPHPLSNGIDHFNQLLAAWAAAKVVLHDVWQITVTLSEGGVFKKIDNATRQKIILSDDRGIPVKTLVKKINNYFSLGVESRIGIGFDRNRQRSAFRNKLVYVKEGVKKSLFHRHTPVSKIIRTMRTINPTTGASQIIFSADKNNMTQRTLKRCASLIAINIPSFASGLDIWKNSHKIGLRNINGTAMNKAKESDFAELSRAAQQMGDGKLEWMTFSNITALGTEQVIEGHGRRIHQGSGPFLLNFQNNLKAEARVYFQMDGEYFIMNKPES